MPYIVAILAVLMLTVVLACAKKSTPAPNPMPNPGPGQTGAVHPSSGPGTRAEMAKRLTDLARSSPPKDLAMGAMCYDTAMAPARAEYICPACGTKTLYAAALEGADPDRTVAREVIDAVRGDVEAGRRMVGQLPGVKASIDESQFCKKCTPDVKTPTLILNIQYTGDAASQRVEGITGFDFQLLNEFLTGENKHKGFTGQEEPLKEYLPRLELILGVTVK
ncbi:MAG: hypothetical protein ABIF71_14535 [Planctomycetota bacterium]